MSAEELDLSHLHPSACYAAARPAPERLELVRAERWIGYPRAGYVLGRLTLLVSAPRRQRMPNLLITGPTNNGKSMIIEKFRRGQIGTNRVGEAPVADRDKPVMVMQMPAEPSAARFYSALLEAAGAWPEDLTTRRNLPQLEQTATGRLSGSGLRVLVIDELHNILAGNASRRREFLNLLRYLGNQLRISLVGVGTGEAYLAIRADDQLENRFQPLALPRWRGDDEQTRSLVASFAAALPLRRASPIATPAMTSYLIERSEGTIGELSTLLYAAATVAITTGEEAITASTLSQTDYLGPTDRRRAFERELN